MSLEEIYTWSGQIAQVFGHLGAWQVLNLALYSLGMVGARHCSPSRVSEQLGVMGKPTTVQRRLERFVDNERIDLRLCCQVWSGWVIGQLVGGRVILLMDETHLGQWLSVMVVGLAYGGCCIPLAWRCYHPHAWPLKQVDLIGVLLRWVAAGLPADCVPVVQADRGIGCSPRLVRVVRKLGWRFLFRVQKTTRFRSRRGREQRLADLVKLGECWAGRGSVFKKAGWLPATVLVMTLAYALTLTAGTLVLSDPETYPVAKLSKSRTPFSVFRLGLRLLTYLDHALHLVLATFITGFHPLPVPCSALPALITVGA